MSQNKPIIYQISRYSGREEESVQENRANKRAMRAKGFVVFNPIDHTHYEERDRTGHPMCPKCQSTDLTWWGPKFDDKHNEILLCMDCNHEFTQKTASYHPLPDYVGEDLAILAAMCDPTPPYHCILCSGDLDLEKHICTQCGAAYSPTAPIYKDLPRYQLKIVAEVLPSALDSIVVLKGLLETEMVQKEGIDWDAMIKCNQKAADYSIGAMKEYLFCRAHHILVISQQTAFDVPWEQWRDHAL